MIKWYKNLDVYIKSCLTTALITLVAFLGCIPLYFNNLGEIPNGIALSGMTFAVLYLLYEIGKNSPGLWKTIIVNLIRFGLVVALLFVTVFLYYKLQIKIFNVFTVVGAFFVSTVVFIVLSLLENRNENDNSN